MARHESDREDLLREATALVERIELSVPGFDGPIVCGFRRDASASFFFGAEPVYQFNSVSQLRRAFVAGRLIKAERGRLIALTRQRLEHEVALVRHELASDELAILIADLGRRFDQLEKALHAGKYVATGQMPRDANVVPRVREWLKNRPPIIEIATIPNVR